MATLMAIALAGCGGGDGAPGGIGTNGTNGVTATNGTNGSNGKDASTAVNAGSSTVAASTADERETAVGPLAGLQRDPTAHGAGRLQCQRRSTKPELQAHGADVDGVAGARALQRE